MTQPPAAQPLAGFGLTGFAGYEVGDDFRGPSLRLDAELALVRDPSRTTLSLLATIGYSRRTGTWPTTSIGNWYVGVVEAPVTLSTLTVVPMLRAARRVSQQFTVFSELGFGLFWATREAAWDVYRETSKYRDLMGRLGAGCSFQVTDRFSVGPMLELTRYYGNHSHEQEQLTFLAQAGALFRL